MTDERGNGVFEALSRRTRDKRVVVLGVGNPLRGDDGLGPALVRRLRGRLAAPLIDAGDTPEDYLYDVEAAHPQVVIIVDAARLGAQPGDLSLVEVAQLGEVVAMTHNTGLALVARLFQTMTGADVFVVAVQPESTAFGAPLSPRVSSTLQALEAMLLGLAAGWKSGQAA
jgi:hydrogenase 3 maturation protease